MMTGKASLAGMQGSEYDTPTTVQLLLPHNSKRNFNLNNPFPATAEAYQQEAKWDCDYSPWDAHASLAGQQAHDAQETLKTALALREEDLKKSQNNFNELANAMKEETRIEQERDTEHTDLKKT